MRSAADFELQARTYSLEVVHFIDSSAASRL